MTLENWKDLATIIGVAIAASTLIKAFLEYRNQGIQKRVERFLEMRKRLDENAQFKEICNLLEDKDPRLAEIPFKEKRDLLGFYEEIAIMLNSGIIRREVAHYMFGYYAIRCWESGDFWRNVRRESPYWAVFKNFALEMKHIDSSKEFKSLGETERFPRRSYRF
jgi:hypothetical protein